MAFKKLKVKVGQVTGTHTNFPTLIQPSLITGLGSITLAEAQSARFYSDVGKTTEIAREIVSADEIHVKVTSMEALAEIWMDYDGIRSDYAVTATYGAENVWSDFDVVVHWEDMVDGTSAVESTGSHTITLGSAVDQTASGQIESGVTKEVSNEPTGLVETNKTSINTSGFSYSVWARPTSWNPGGSGDFRVLAEQYRPDNIYYVAINATDVRWKIIDSSNNLNSTIDFNVTNSLNVWAKWDFVWDGSTNYIYKDGDEVGSATQTSIRNIATTLTLLTSVSSDWVFRGQADEIRFTSNGVARSANWITTEYNNQNANGSFWEATDAGGGGSTPAQAARRGAVMMM